MNFVFRRYDNLWQKEFRSPDEQRVLINVHTYNAKEVMLS